MAGPSRATAGVFFVLWPAYAWRNIRADHSPTWPICSSTAYSWMNNARGQTPCDVALILAKLNDGILQAPVSGNSQSLTGPSYACNTVMYSLACACFTCANVEHSQNLADWSRSFGCSDFATREFPDPIPTDTAIPAWAYLALSNDQFDIQEAQSVASERALTRLHARSRQVRLTGHHLHRSTRCDDTRQLCVHSPTSHVHGSAILARRV
ncbi:hypothetical protein OH77DRAFT_752296 [Trametes cingulata]|nr:hypothetical protein OH77DRAFT_752296 [Trametes cingulata]